MSLKKVLPYALTGLITLASACGGDDDDDPTDPGNDTPTVAEVQNMMTALSTALSAALSGAGPAGIAAQQNIPFEFSGSCPNGGTSTVSGSYNAISQTSFNYSLTQSFNQCAAPGNGTIYTFNGTGLTTTAVYTLTGSNFDYDISQSGTLAWSGGGKSATCSVNWTVNLLYNNSTGAYTYDYGGTFCGVSIS